VSANVVKKAQDYRWGSLSNWLGGDSAIELAPWPLRRLPNWANRVNQAIAKKSRKHSREVSIAVSSFWQRTMDNSHCQTTGA